MVVTQAAELDTQHLGSRSRMWHRMERLERMVSVGLPQDARLVSSERWTNTSSSPLPHVSCTLGSPLFQAGASRRGVVRVRHAVVRPEALSTAAAHNERTRCPALANRPRARPRSTVSSRLRDRCGRGVMGDPLACESRWCGRRMAGAGLVCC